MLKIHLLTCFLILGAVLGCRKDPTPEPTFLDSDTIDSTPVGLLRLWRSPEVQWALWNIPRELRFENPSMQSTQDTVFGRYVRTAKNYVQVQYERNSNSYCSIADDNIFAAEPYRINGKIGHLGVANRGELMIFYTTMAPNKGLDGGKRHRMDSVRIIGRGYMDTCDVFDTLYRRSLVSYPEDLRAALDTIPMLNTFFGRLGYCSGPNIDAKPSCPVVVRMDSLSHPDDSTTVLWWHTRANTIPSLRKGFARFPSSKFDLKSRMNQNAILYVRVRFFEELGKESRSLVEDWVLDSLRPLSFGPIQDSVRQ